MSLWILAVGDFEFHCSFLTLYLYCIFLKWNEVNSHFLIIWKACTNLVFPSHLKACTNYRWSHLSLGFSLWGTLLFISSCDGPSWLSSSLDLLSTKICLCLGLWGHSCFKGEREASSQEWKAPSSDCPDVKVSEEEAVAVCPLSAFASCLWSNLCSAGLRDLLAS